MESKEKKQAIIDTVVQLSSLIEDTANERVKEDLLFRLKNMTKNLNLVCIGPTNAGKSSLINALVNEKVCDVSPLPCTNKIFELKYSERNVSVPVNSSVNRTFIQNNYLKGVTFVDTPGIGSAFQSHNKITEEYLRQADIMLIVLSPETIYQEEFWQVLKANLKESLGEIVFILQQIDTIELNEIEEFSFFIQQKSVSLFNEVKMIFKVSAEFISLDKNEIEQCSNYIDQQFKGPEALMKKHSKDLDILNKYFLSFENAFNNRIEQNTLDLKIVGEINNHIDATKLNHKEKMKNIYTILKDIIYELVDAYENDVLSNVNPLTIKERFKSSNDFLLWLDTKNDYYIKQLIEKVGIHVDLQVKSYLSDLEMLVYDVEQVINQEKNYLALSDDFFGSLIEQRQSIVLKSKNYLSDLKLENQTLKDTTQNLYLAILKARNDYDKKVNVCNALTTGGVSITGGVVAAWITNSLVAGTGAAGAVGAATVTATAVGVGVGVFLISGYLAFKISRKIFKSMYESEFYEQSGLAIQQFKNTIFETKKQMHLDAYNALEWFFELQFSSFDKQFIDFRKNVYLESQKVRDDQQIFKMLNLHEIEELFIEAREGEEACNLLLP